MKQEGIIISRELAGKMEPGWEKIILENGEVFNWKKVTRKDGSVIFKTRGDHLWTIKEIRDVILSDGEIDFHKGDGSKSCQD